MCFIKKKIAKICDKCWKQFHGQLIFLVTSYHTLYEVSWTLWLEGLKTYPADCRKKAAVDSHNSIGIERKENINKN